jgi:hypothetical protein
VTVLGIADGVDMRRANLVVGCCNSGRRSLSKSDQAQARFRSELPYWGHYRWYGARPSVTRGFSDIWKW